MDQDLTALAQAHQAYVKRDAPWQTRLRLAQALWREEMGLPMGTIGDGVPLGSLLPWPECRESGANFLTDHTRAVVQECLSNKTEEKIDEERLYRNLLTSQALAFNLFAEFVDDPGRLSGVFDELTDGVLSVVEDIRFEYAPARGDPAYTGDRSAYDVWILGSNRRRESTFVGIEVKHHEDLMAKPAKIRPRHCELASELFGRAIGADDPVFRPPLEQITRDRLLVHAHQTVEAYPQARFILLVTEQNEACRAIARRWSWDDGFQYLTLEQLIRTMRNHLDDGWVYDLEHRYVAISQWLLREERLMAMTNWAAKVREIPLDLPVHLRPTARGVTLVSLRPEAPQVGKGPYKKLGRLRDQAVSLLEAIEPPARPTPEKSLQSWMVRRALQDGRRLRDLERPGEAISFITDEISLVGLDGKVVGDLIAVVHRDGIWAPMTIELKSDRHMTRLIDQVGNMAHLIDAHATKFAELASALLDVDLLFEGDCEKAIVWPAAGEREDPRRSELAGLGIRCYAYEQTGNQDFAIRPERG